MPELPEVETVKEVLKSQILNETIENVTIYYDKIIEYPTKGEFIKQIKNETIKDIQRRGKWLLFILNDYILLSHLRMEGRYYLKTKGDEKTKHDHVVFTFKSGKELWYRDTRKFGRMYLYKKEEAYLNKPLNELGLEPWSNELTSSYLKEKLSKKNIPIKTSLLDQSIVVGLGNIYVNEVLYLSKINPLKKSNTLSINELDEIIENTKVTLKNAIKLGGTTIKSYESSEGVHGNFQNELYVHGKKICKNCNSDILKITVGGRGTYYCPKCQK
jgi:formamidopyrimidine-DNA glycosylase